MPVVILLADGVRPDVLAASINRGDLPALARLRAEGGLHTITSCFPSVTGPAYAPFLMGRFPGSIGLSGLRWFDRERTTCSFPDYTRSYVGHQMLAVDRDIAADVPTIFELCDTSIGGLSVITRGLGRQDRIGTITLRSAMRATRTHFTGNVRGWLQIDREVGETLAHRLRTDRPEFAFCALTGVDKASHAAGHDAPLVTEALKIVDDTAATIRADAERLGYWKNLSLWVVSDHGHSRVLSHDGLAELISSLGFRVVAHPWVFTRRPEVAVMVSGNAMAHVYLDVSLRKRPLWPSLANRWTSLVDTLLERPSVDLAILPRADGAEVRSRHRGSALVLAHGDRFSYRRTSGDPLQVGADLDSAHEGEALEATLAGDYPDSIVQIAHIAAAPRSGEIILSAARDWDFRARYEPIPHVSSHGALHREHMLVPLLLNQAAVREPRRTVDVMPSALAALGRGVPHALDGRSFL